MDLGNQNIGYWKKYRSGTTPGVSAMPPPELLMKLPEKATILDVGTGTGTLADSLTKHGFKIFGIDINLKEINANKARGTKVTYSTQNIATKTSFADGFFDLVIFRYTLTNIHKDQWQKMSDEVDRITKSGSYVWIAEPHVNSSYKQRYALGRERLGDDQAFYVFKDKTMASRVTNRQTLERAIGDDEVARIVRHYTVSELESLFPKFRKVSSSHINDMSPSGFPLDTVVMALRKIE